MKDTYLTVAMARNERDAAHSLATQRKCSVNQLFRAWVFAECDAAGIVVTPRQRRKYERRTKEVTL